MGTFEMIIGKIVYIFSDLIFLHLFGWAINPLYNHVANIWAPVIADSMLLLIEFIFYGAVLGVIVILVDRFLKKKRKEKRQNARYEKIEDLESNDSSENVKSESNDSEEKGEEKPYREYV